MRNHNATAESSALLTKVMSTMTLRLVITRIVARSPEAPEIPATSPKKSWLARVTMSLCRPIATFARIPAQANRSARLDDVGERGNNDLTEVSRSRRVEPGVR